MNDFFWISQVLVWALPVKPHRSGPAEQMWWAGCFQVATSVPSVPHSLDTLVASKVQQNHRVHVPLSFDTKTSGFISIVCLFMSARKFQNSTAQGARAHLCDLPRVRSADRLPIHVVPRAAASHGLPAAHGWHPRDAGGAGGGGAAECHGAATAHGACDSAADAAKAGDWMILKCFFPLKRLGGCMASFKGGVQVELVSLLSCCCLGTEWLPSVDGCLLK